ncbi:MAG: hypothetical protein ABSD08_14660 [Xanthobacteraceae bacterium]|jgi:hypothetical protein
MTFPLSRRLTAVPKHWPVRMEIVKTMRTLAAQEQDQQLRRRAEVAAIRRDDDLLAEAIREACRELSKAGYDPNEPRWPKGSGEISGRWSGGSGGGPAAAAHKPGNSSAKDNKLRARDIPASNPKHPVSFVDSAGEPVTDGKGNPLLRPADLSPEIFVQAGLQMKQVFFGLTQAGVTGPAVALLVEQLSQFRQGGTWDAERFEGQYVTEYQDYATTAIGLYMAAAGIPYQLALLIQSAYVAQDFRLLSAREVRDTQIGYELYQSGRISPRQ